jgi:hypothetical protein
MGAAPIGEEPAEVGERLGNPERLCRALDGPDPARLTHLGVPSWERKATKAIISLSLFGTIASATQRSSGYPAAASRASCAFPSESG